MKERKKETNVKMSHFQGENKNAQPYGAWTQSTMSTF